MPSNVRFVNYPEHYKRIWGEVSKSLEDCLSNGDLIMRSQLSRFEDDLASFVGKKYAVGLNSGTDALFFSLKAADIGAGDEVITVSHTFVATIAAIKYCDARPVLVDVAEDMNIDVSQIEKAITPRTKAIIPVHLNGRVCDMAAINEIASEHNLTVIEDAAQSLGAKFSGEMAGSFGLTSCFSFYPAKILGCAGDGGALVTDDENVAIQARLLRDHGYDRPTGKILLYGYNSRLDNIQAAMLSIKLKYLPMWIERRREIAARYQNGLEGVAGITLPPAPENNGKYYDVFQNYVIRSSHRDKLFQYLKENGVETLISWPIPTHHQDALGLGEFSLPATEKLSNEVISLPMFPELRDEELEYVINMIREFES